MATVVWKNTQITPTIRDKLLYYYIKGQNNQKQQQIGH